VQVKKKKTCRNLSRTRGKKSLDSDDLVANMEGERGGQGQHGKSQSQV